jgi:DNA-binding protein HU-beta
MIRLFGSKRLSLAILQVLIIFDSAHRRVQRINIFVMNKAMLADVIHAKIGGTKVQAEEVVQLFIDEITKTLKKGDDVSLAGLGIFSAKARAARTARNPKTGEAVHVAATTVPKFRAAKALKDAVK